MYVNLSISQFLVNTNELNEKEKLHEVIFSYIFQKYILHHHADLYPANKSLSEFRVFMNSYCGQSHPSTVYYMQLLNENPDCPKTMSLVAEDLLSKFDGVQDRWVLLVGDGKTYKHLMSNTTKTPNLSWRLAYFKKLPANLNKIILRCWFERNSKDFRLPGAYIEVHRAVL